MQRFFLIAAAGLSILSSCVGHKERDLDEQTESGIYASVEQIDDTKTYLDDADVRWASGDMIILFDGSSAGSCYKISEESVGQTSARFVYKGPTGEDHTGMKGSSVAVYPFDEDVEIVNSGSGTFKVNGLEIQEVQLYKEGSFADGSFPMLAVNDGDSSSDYEFRNVCGGLKLQLYGDCAVREIEVSGNNAELLAGPAYIYAYTDGKVPQIAMHPDASRTVVLDCGDKGVSLSKSEATDFIITLPPVDFSKGFSVLIRDVSGRELSLKTSSRNSVLRSSLLRMPAASFAVIPAGQDVVYDLDKDKYSATYAEFNITFGEKCQTAFHYTMKMDEPNADGNLKAARDYYEGSAASRRKLAEYLYSYGYSMIHPESGSVRDASWMEYTLEPDTEYVMAYCCKDIYGVLSPVYFTEPFRTKPLQKESPQSNKSDISLEFSDVTRTSLKFNFTYDPSNTAVIRFICIKNGDMNLYEAYGEADVPEPDALQEELRIFFDKMSKSLFMNVWPRSASGTDQYTLLGLEPGSEIVYAYLAEDMNGVWSEIKIAETVMKEDKPGPDPEVSIDPVWDPSTKTWTVIFNMVKDCSRFKYTLNCDDNMYLTRLGTDQMMANEFYNHWYNFVYNYGLETSFDSVTHVSEPAKNHVALAVSWGKDAGGRDVISGLEYIILTKDGQQKKLSSYYPSYSEQ